MVKKDDLKIGDVVLLKVENKKMVVIELLELSAKCFWLDKNDTPQEAFLPYSVLEVKN